MEKEAEEKIRRNERSQAEFTDKIAAYNQAIVEINNCLQAMQLFEHLLPVIGASGLIPASSDLEEHIVLNDVDISYSNGKVEAVEV